MSMVPSLSVTMARLVDLRWPHPKRVRRRLPERFRVLTEATSTLKVWIYKGDLTAKELAAKEAAQPSGRGRGGERRGGGERRRRNDRAERAPRQENAGAGAETPAAAPAEGGNA